MSIIDNNITIKLKAVESYNHNDSTVIFDKLNDILLEKELVVLLNECAAEKRESQKKIYYVFYEFALGVCLRYADNKDDAVEIMNDGFLKIFKGIKNYTVNTINVIASFKAWVKKIMIYSAIDSYRKKSKHKLNISLDETLPVISNEDSQIEKLSYKEIVESIQTLTPVYRTVFCLYVIDGFKHEEIAQQLNIAIGTSKSNLAKARLQLQKKLLAKQKYSDYEHRAV